MTGFRRHTIALAIGLAFSAGAAAQSMSKEEYKSAQDGIAVERNSAKADCQSLSGNAKDICVAKAGGPLTEVVVGSGSARGLENAVVAVNSAVAVVEERSVIVDELVDADLARVVEESPGSVVVVVVVDMTVELVEALSDDVSIVEGDSSAVTVAEPVAGLIAPPDMAAGTDPM